MSFKYYRFSKDVILNCVRWYLRYKLSYRDLEEMMSERGVKVDHATLNRWVLKFSPLLMTEARKHKHSVGSSWRLDETYIKSKGIGNTYTELLIRMEIPSTFCSQPSEISKLRFDF